MTNPTDESSETRVRVLYDQLLNSWNSQDAAAIAALFCEDGELVGFDGSQQIGREEIAAVHLHLFAEHPTAAYVSIVRTVRFPVPEIAVLRAAVGMIPPGQRDIEPASNAIQVLVAARTEGGWRIVSLQNTPARFHGRPDLNDALTAELRYRLQQG